MLSSAVAFTVLLAACGDGDSRTLEPASITPTASVNQSNAPNGSPSTSATTDPSANSSSVAFSAERAMNHVQVLADKIGIRAAGTEGERVAAEYLRKELATYGYEATLQPFATEVLEGIDIDLLLGPEQLRIEANLLSGAPEGVAEGRLVFAGLGKPGDFPAGIQGAIALIERGELTFGTKVANAFAAGAAAAVVYNNEAGIFEGALDVRSDILAVSISREDGLALRDLTGGGEPTASLSVRFQRSVGESRNVVARTPGTVCAVVIGGHFDSVPAGPGANDNASGTAVVMELARVLALSGQTEGLCIALFGAEEVGLLGSEKYVANLATDDAAAIEAMLNFDMLGVGDDWPLSGTNDLVQLAAQEAEERGIPYRLSGLPAGVGSDHASFNDVGIPNIIFNCFCDPNYHTSADRAAAVRPARLAQAGEIGLGMLEVLLAD